MARKTQAMAVEILGEDEEGSTDDEQPQQNTQQEQEALESEEESDDQSEDEEGSISSTDDEQPQQNAQQEQEAQESEEESDDQSEDEEGSISSTDDEQPQPNAQQEQEAQESEEESDDQSEDEEGSISSTDDEHPQQNAQQEQEAQESEEESAADSPCLQQPQPQEDSDADYPCYASAFTVMPTVPKLEMPKQNLDEPVSKNQAKGVNRKRPAHKLSDGFGQRVDKGKNVLSGDEEGGKIEQKKSVFKWSQEAENALLVAMIDYKADTGDDVNSTMDVFHDYVKRDSLLGTLTKTQLYEKIGRLKKKYQTNVEKWQNGAEPVFSRPHDKKLFELSHKIWGSQGALTQGNSTRVLVANRELSVQEEVEDAIMEDNNEEETQDFWSLYPLLCASLKSEAFDNLSLKFCDLKEYVKMMITGFGEEKARELEDEWKAIHVMDFQLYSKRVRLINKVDSLCKNLSQ